MTLVVDANVAVKWYVDQIDRPKAMDVQRYAGGLLAPDILIAECASAFWMHVRQADITSQQAGLAIDAIAGCFNELVDTAALARPALDLAFELTHSPWDCFYLVLAEQRGCQLVTADQTCLSPQFRHNHAVGSVEPRSWAMSDMIPDDLWRTFPKTAPAFEARFATEEDCRAYWIEARWGGKPACARCASTRVWTIRNGTTFECADCGHQTSLTSGTVLEKTRKPLKMWFRAIFEISTRRTGISGKDLQRIMGFGSYETAWTWLHKLRRAMVRSDSEPLGPFVEMDEALVGGKGGPHKQLVLTATEKGGRVRLAHAENNDAETCRRFADGEVATQAAVVTDGHAGYSEKSLGERAHDVVVQTKAQKREADAVQTCHWTISLLKRWLIGTHAGAVKPKHLQAYLDEFTFRHNRRKTDGVARIAARVIESLVAKPPLTMRSLVDTTKPHRRFASDQPIVA